VKAVKMPYQESDDNGEENEMELNREGEQDAKDQ
jgi:hypothetical protein